ncbi:MAG: branched-chain amino acid aminotransferase [Candidatus Sericytochromatia bacterium]|nr:branched-chain amino acid aminotransferase [Candidatus Sericytochromatia bacterium]
MEIEVKKVDISKIKDIDFDNLQFGNVFSDHVLSIDYKDNKWQKPQILPYGPMEIFPSLSSLHYGQTIFEGMKAFRAKDGKISVFRPDRHHQRLNRSARRLCIPEMSYELFINTLTQLIKVESDWIPDRRGYSLYLRPFTFATDNFLGVKISDTYKYMIISCPVGAYYKEGLNPISLCTSGEYVRAVKGGLGEAKTPANYAASLLPAQEAKEKGFTQVIWLDGIERKYIDEIGTTNIFFLIDNQLITPPLDGAILEGITRDSVITVAKDWGIEVIERRISIDEVFEMNQQNRLKDIFGTGTAAVISPVGKIEHLGKEIIINNGKIGDLSQKMYDEITAIQYGEKEDKFNWNYHIY